MFVFVMLMCNENKMVTNHTKNTSKVCQLEIRWWSRILFLLWSMQKWLFNIHHLQCLSFVLLCGLSTLFILSWNWNCWLLLWHSTHKTTPFFSFLLSLSLCLRKRSVKAAQRKRLLILSSQAFEISLFSVVAFAWRLSSCKSQIG